MFAVVLYTAVAMLRSAIARRGGRGGDAGTRHRLKTGIRRRTFPCVSRSSLAAGALVALIAAAAACKKGGAAAPPPRRPRPSTPNAAAAAGPASAAAAQELFEAMKLQASLNDTTAAMIDSEIARNPGLTPYREHHARSGCAST